MGGPHRKPPTYCEKVRNGSAYLLQVCILCTLRLTDNFASGSINNGHRLALGSVDLRLELIRL